MVELGDTMGERARGQRWGESTEFRTHVGVGPIEGLGEIAVTNLPMPGPQTVEDAEVGVSPAIPRPQGPPKSEPQGIQKV